MVDIKDKIVLITGGAAGIGASVVRILLEENIKHITILDTDEINGIAIEKELNTKYGGNKVKFIKCDIAQEQELLNAFSDVKNEQGYIDVVINNAGIVNDATFSKEIEINYTAVVRSTLQAWDLMRKDKGGKGGTVINVASSTALAHITSFPVYSGTKAAVVKFSTTIGDEIHFSRTGIRVLTVCFGVTNTKLAQQKMKSFDSVIEDGLRDIVMSFNIQTPDEAAQGVLEMYKRGKSGSVWVVTSGKPAVDVTEKYIQGIKAFDDIVYS